MNSATKKRIRAVFPFQSLFSQIGAGTVILLSIALATYAFAWKPKQNQTLRSSISYLVDMQEQIERLSISTSNSQLAAVEQEAADQKRKFQPSEKEARATIANLVDSIAQRGLKVEYLPLGTSQSSHTAELGELQSEIKVQRPSAKKDQKAAPPTLPLDAILKQLRSAPFVNEIIQLQVQSEIDGIQNVTLTLLTPFLRQDEKAAE